MTEYLIKFRKFHGPNDVWAESVDGVGLNANDREAAIREIEESEHEVAGVLAVNFIEGRFEARDVTASVMADVADREAKFLRDRYDETRPDISFHEFMFCHAKFARAA